MSNMNNGNIASGAGGASNSAQSGGGGDSPRHLRMYHPRHSPHARTRWVAIQVCAKRLLSRLSTIAFRGLDPQRGYTSDPLSPDQPGGGYVVNGQQGISVAQSQRGGTTTATPTMQQRIKPLGVATPLVSASPVRRWVVSESTHRCSGAVATNRFSS